MLGAPPHPFLTHQPYQAEVGDLDLRLPIGSGQEQDVGGLEVAMHHAAFVSVGQAGKNMPKHARRPRRIQFPPFCFHPIGQGDAWLPGGIDAVGQFHAQPVAAAGLAEVIDLEDIRMLQGRHHPGLALEPLQRAGRGGELRRQQFQRIPPVQHGMLHLIHLAHPAAAEQADNTVLPQHRARIERRGGTGRFRRGGGHGQILMRQPGRIALKLYRKKKGNKILP